MGLTWYVLLMIHDKKKHSKEETHKKRKKKKQKKQKKKKKKKKKKKLTRLCAWGGMRLDEVLSFGVVVWNWSGCVFAEGAVGVCQK